MTTHTRVTRRVQFGLKGIFIIVTLAGIALGLIMHAQHSQSVCYTQQSVTDTIFTCEEKSMRTKFDFESIEVKLGGGQADRNGFQWDEKIRVDSKSEGCGNVVSIKVEGGVVYLIGFLRPITIHGHGSSRSKDLIKKLTQA
jgi:osmotically-inducible protein OsmY